jgi:hypothetical protein
MNVGGEPRGLVYGSPITVHIDPIEKKPFYQLLNLPPTPVWTLELNGNDIKGHVSKVSKGDPL